MCCRVLVSYSKWKFNLELGSWRHFRNTLSYLVLWLVGLVIRWLVGFSSAAWSPLPLTLAGWKGAASALSARCFDLSLSNLPHLISQFCWNFSANCITIQLNGLEVGTGLESWLTWRKRDRLRQTGGKQVEVLWPSWIVANNNIGGDNLMKSDQVPSIALDRQ